MNLPWYKRYWSYLFPITVLKPSSEIHDKLSIKYFRGQIQLESDDALYSDGERYTPFRLGYNRLAKNGTLQNVKTFLLLGAGLGSALRRLHSVYNLHPETFLVEHDEAIIALSKEYLLLRQKQNVQFICADASQYIFENQNKFDLIGVDLFEQLRNSSIIEKEDFWMEIKKSLTSSGHVIVNTIFIDKKERRTFENLLDKAFTFDCLVRKPNYIYILQLKT
jgi:predicted membrane-bound spermidine synthase